jgi:DNA-binding NtrC family response regulator
LPEGAGVLRVDEAEVRVVAGPDRGTRFPLGAASIRIGSAATCDLVLHDATVSAQHAEIVLRPQGYVLRDLGSTNGTRLGPWLIETAPLCHGLRVSLGKSVISVHASGTQRAIPLAEPGCHGELTAYSVKMRAVVAVLESLAQSDITVLIEGETGSGKEVAALTLHQRSARQRGPFVVFDCGAVPSSLLAAELFGAERGAFTGATAKRSGVFREAEGGTLFLDEIGELPLAAQPTLLRALERKRTRPLGGAAEIQHDVRLVAATNRNLREEVRQGRFREDLFHRLAVATIRIPPLRERPEDIPVLAQTFAAELGVTISPELVVLLSSYDWPGNIRELRNTIARGAARLPEPAAAPAGPRPLVPLPQARRTAMDDFERRYLEWVVREAGGVLTRAAQIAGVSRQIITRLAAKHGIRVRDR